MPAGLGALLVVRFFDEAVAFLPAGAAESIRIDVRLSYAQIGLLLSIPAAGALVGNLFVAAADRRSRRVIAGGGGIATAAALAAFAGAGSFWALAFAAVAYGAGATAMVDGAEVALVDTVGGSALRRVLARSNLFGALGDLAGPALLATAVAVGLGWRVSFASAAVVVLAYAWWLGASPLPAPRRRAEEHDRDVGGAEAVPPRTLWRDCRVWHLGLITLLIGPLDEALLGFLIAFLQHERGLTPAMATVAGGSFVLGGILAFTVVADRLQHRPDGTIVIASAVAMAGAIVAVLVIPSSVVIVPAGLVFDIGLCCAWLVLQHRTLTLVPGRAGATSAVISTIEMAGAVIPPLIGVVADRYGLPAGLWAFALLPLAIAALGVRFPARS